MGRPRKTHQQYEEQLLEIEASCYPVEQYVKDNVHILHECVEGHQWCAKPSHILEGTKCPYCAGNKKPSNKEYINKMRGKGIDFVLLDDYINSRTAIAHQCVKGHIWATAPTNILAGTGCPECGKSKLKGLYSPKYFQNNPEEAKKPGLLYIVVLVNRKTFKREAVKIGITKGTNFRDALKRAGGFTGYDIRIQKLVTGPLEEIYYLEQYLHELWADERYFGSHKFGGHTELFQIDKLPEILRSIPEEL